MPLRLIAVTFDVDHPHEVAEFWAGVLGREAVGESGGVAVPGEDNQVGLRFRPGAGKRSGTHRLHLHVTSTSLPDQQRTVDRAVNLGARHVDVGQLPEDGHVVLADPGGNLFCVIEPQNDFLAGTGLLGEVTCEGSRTVGLFWRDALEWPLVWDHGGQTAIQSPLGGTKLSWDEEGMVSVPGSSGQRFDLAAVDLGVEGDRLVALGATRIRETDGLIRLSDPDGNEFSVGQV